MSLLLICILEVCSWRDTTEIKKVNDLNDTIEHYRYVAFSDVSIIICCKPSDNLARRTVFCGV
jgi:hypothetical protein